MNSTDAGKEVVHETRAAMESRGMNLNKGLDKLNQLLEAKKVIGPTALEVADNQTQIKALDMYFGLRGDKPVETKRIEFNEGLLAPLLNALPPDLQAPVKALLLEEISKKKKG